MKNSNSCLSDLQKCKKEIRSLAATKTSGNRNDACAMNDEFRRKSGTLMEFVSINQAKLTCLLSGDRDAHPNDIGRFHVSNHV